MTPALVAVLLAQVPCEAPWRALGTTLEALRVENDELIVCAHNGGAYPPPDPILEACAAWSSDGGVRAVPAAPRATTPFTQATDDGGVLACRAPGACVPLRLGAAPVEPPESAMRADGTQAAVLAGAELQLYDATTGARTATLTVTAPHLACAEAPGWVGPFPWARAVECDGPRGTGFLYVGTRRVRTPWRSPPSVVAWAPDGGSGWLAVTQQPSAVYRVDGAGTVTPIAKLPSLDWCQFDGCAHGAALLFGLTPMSVISADVPVAALTPDGGLAVVSASGWAIVNPATGAAKARLFTPCR